MEVGKAKDIMIKEIATIRAENSQKSVSVINKKNELVGMVTEHDVMNFAFSGSVAEATVKGAMTSSVIAFSSEDDIKKLADAFLKKRIRRIPIVEGNKLVGIVSCREILCKTGRWYS